MVSTHQCELTHALRYEYNVPTSDLKRAVTMHSDTQLTRAMTPADYKAWFGTVEFFEGRCGWYFLSPDGFFVRINP